jgi:predicted DNA-binding WGR domain protein
MNKSYVIQWKSKVNGRAGRGTKLFDREEAQRLVEELNREYPQIEHGFVEAQPASTEPREETPVPNPTPLFSLA